MENVSGFKGSIVVKNKGEKKVRISFYDKCATALEKDMGTLELAPGSEGVIECSNQCVGFSMPAGGYLLEMRFVPSSAMRAFYVGVVSVPDVP